VSVVIDCSVALVWYLPDETSVLADDALGAVETSGALVPVHFKAEFANGLTMGVRRKRITAAFRGEALEELARLPLDYDVAGLDAVWREVPELADAHGLTIYDALYLELALRQRIPLATLDKSLRRAATDAGAKLFEMGV
jgi:predicted nucleic acid-binding protein